MRVQRVGEAGIHQDVLDGVVLKWNGSPEILGQSVTTLATANPGTHQVLFYDDHGALGSVGMPDFAKLPVPVFILRGGMKAWQDQIVLDLGRMGGRKLTLSSVTSANGHFSVGAARRTGGSCCGGKK